MVAQTRGSASLHTLAMFCRPPGFLSADGNLVVLALLSNGYCIGSGDTVDEKDASNGLMYRGFAEAQPNRKLFIVKRRES